MEKLERGRVRQLEGGSTSIPRPVARSDDDALQELVLQFQTSQFQHAGTDARQASHSVCDWLLSKDDPSVFHAKVGQSASCASRLLLWGLSR
jgi:hypothetical protein